MGLINWFRRFWTHRARADAQAAASALATAREMVARGETRQAIDLLSRLRRRQQTPEVLIELARAHTSINNLASALKCIFRILEQDPGSAPALCAHAEVMLAVGERDAAITRFNEALRADPQSAEAQRRLRELASDTPDPVSAIVGHIPKGGHTAAPRDEPWVRSRLVEMAKQGTALKRQGRLPEAEQIHHDAVRFAGVMLGQEHPVYAACLSRLALLYTQGGDRARALPLFRRALEVNEKALGQRHPEIVTDLNNLAALHLTVGDHAAAEPLLQRATEICRAVLAEGDPAYVSTLNNLAVLRKRKCGGDDAEAKALIQRAVEAFRTIRGGNSPEHATSPPDHAGVPPGSGDQAQAKLLLNLAEQRLGDSHEVTVTARNNLAAAYMSQANYAAAEPLLRQNLAAVEKGHPEAFAILSNMAALHHARGDYAAAEAMLRRAADASGDTADADPARQAMVLHNQAGLHKARGDYEAAERLFWEALTASLAGEERDRPETATILSGLAALYHIRGDFFVGEPLLRWAEEIWLKNGGPHSAGMALVLHNRAALYKGRGDYAAAEPLYLEALAAYEKSVGPDHPDAAMTLHNLAGVYAARGNWADAERLFGQALAVTRITAGVNHLDTASTLRELASVEVAIGRTDAALARMHEAAAIIDKVIGQVFASTSEARRMAFLRTVFQLDMVLSLVRRHFSDSAPAVRGALDLVLRRKGIGAEALVTQRDAILGGRYPHLREAFDQLHQLRRRIAQRMLAGPTPGESLADLEQSLHQWQQDQQQRETDLARQIPEMNLQQQLHKADHRAVALSLPEGVALAEFVRFHIFDFHAVPARGERQWQPARYLAFVLTAGRPEQVRMIDLGSADSIDALIADFRAGITTPPWERPDRGLQPLGQATGGVAASQAPLGLELRQRVFDALVPALGGCLRLWLCPDGDLVRLPFEALPGPEEGKRLLDSYRISYLATGRDALRCGRPAARPPAPPIVAADPDFDLGEKSPPRPRQVQPDESQPRRSRDIDRAALVKRLPDTRLEGQQVAALLGVEPMLDTVLDQPFKSVRSPRILHLATHGFFLEDQQNDPGTSWSGLGPADRLAGARLENPMLRSGLLLAGFNTWRNGGQPPPEAEDGMLTAEDVTGMDLLDTELVVLSACETGLGQIHVGEGVFGLRRAFAVAGAKTLVMSLWKVPDEQTQELMVDFYRRVLGGGGAPRRCARRKRPSAPATPTPTTGEPSSARATLGRCRSDLAAARPSVSSPGGSRRARRDALARTARPHLSAGWQTRPWRFASRPSS